LPKNKGIFLKKIFSFLCIIFFTAFLHAEKHPLSKEIFFSSSVFITAKKNSKPYSGIADKFYSDGQHEMSGFFINGKAYGTLIGYYPDGTLHYTMPCYKGNPDGKVKIYNKDGVLEYEFNFNRGVAQGTAKKYYFNGRLKSKANYRDNKLDGLEIVYDKNGKIESKTTYSNGLVHGKSVHYHKNGKIASETKFINGKAEGELKTYFKSGEIASKADLKNNLLNGKAIIFEKGSGYFIDLTCRDGNIIKGYFVNESGKKKVLRKSQINKCYRNLSVETYTNKTDFFVFYKDLK
jgi:antitoxin component YwqK of YwqJK toxin-antitoxin module